MNLKRKLYLLLTLGCTIPLFASINIDSLEVRLNDLPYSEEKLETLYRLADGTRETNLRLSDRYIQQGLDLADVLVRRGDHALRMYQSRFYNLRGVSNLYQGNNGIAIAQFIRGLRIAEQIPAPLEICNISNNLGMVYCTTGKLEEGISYFKNSLMYSRLSESLEEQLSCVHNIATGYQMLHVLDSAQAYYHKALDLGKEIGSKKDLSETYANLGVLYKENGEAEKALSYYTEGLKLEQSALNFIGMAGSYNNIGMLYYSIGNYKKALEYADKCFDVASKVGFLEEIMHAWQLRMFIAKEQKHFDKAFEYQEHWVLFKDSIFNIETARQIADVESHYENDHLNNQNEIQVLQLKQQEQHLFTQKVLLYGAIGGLILLLAWAFQLVKTGREKKKQNLQIEMQRIDAVRQKEVFEEKNQEILASISYAKIIQSAILPPARFMKEVLNDMFVYFKPKDIVSGDFYWMEKSNEKVFFTAADCTGHGVPGAMVSVMCSNYLSRAVREMKLTQPAPVLDAVVDMLDDRFSLSEEAVSDGMDLALVALDLSTRKLSFAGANNPLYIVRKIDGDASLRLDSTTEASIYIANSEQFVLFEIKADKQPVGKCDYRKAFTNQTMNLEKNDVIYVFSDGFPDQFGGARGKKYKYKPFKELLCKIQDQPMRAQEGLLNDEFERWKGAYEQVDDLCVIGVKV